VALDDAGAVAAAGAVVAAGVLVTGVLDAFFCVVFGVVGAASGSWY
jgi:hypothetical protein